MLAIMVSAAGCGASHPAVTPLDPQTDPQALVGEWEGTWTISQFRGYSNVIGRYVLKINAVGGGYVYGMWERPDQISARSRGPWSFFGKLDGNVIVFPPSGGTKTEFTVQGNLMRGWTYWDQRIEILLMKSQAR